MTNDWEEVEGTVGKVVYFTVYDCNGDAEDISGNVVTLKVWDDDSALLNFTGACILVGGGLLGRCRYTIVAGDVAIGDEGVYGFVIELTSGGVTRPTIRGILKILQGSPV